MRVPSDPLRILPAGLLSVCAYMLVSPTAAAQEEHVQRERMFAKPRLAQASPFKVTELEDVDLPVALSGFSSVTLRDQQQWQPGNPQHQLVFDGQIFWFVNARELEIFAASPLEYAPVLGGDCAVTFSETRQRVQGQLQHGLVFGRRIYLFHNAENLNRFRGSPSRYADSDLALAGNCIVTQIEERRDVQGLPETTAMVNGLRYQFLGDFQRRQFAAHMQRYGVRRQLLVPIQGSRYQRPSAAVKKEKVEKEKAKALATESRSAPLQSPFVMNGYCPVTFEKKAAWVRGSAQYQSKFEDKTYLMVSAKEKQEFESEPEAYVPVLGGDCLVTRVDEDASVPGSVYHAYYDPEEEQKLYLFAGPEKLEAFVADPEKYRSHLKSAVQKEDSQKVSEETTVKPGAGVQ